MKASITCRKQSADSTPPPWRTEACPHTPEPRASTRITVKSREARKATQYFYLRHTHQHDCANSMRIYNIRGRWACSSKNTRDSLCYISEERTKMNITAVHTGDRCCTKCRRFAYAFAEFDTEDERKLLIQQCADLRSPHRQQQNHSTHGT